MERTRFPIAHARMRGVAHRNDNAWKHWYDEDAPEQARIPDLEDKLSLFEKLLLVRSIREDRTLLCVADYVVDVLGKRYVDSRPLDLRLLQQDSDKFTPMIVLLTMGADPTNAITELAKRKKKQIRAISMGQGQEPAVRKLLTMGMQQGSWVLLQNCHLGLKMMEELETFLQGRRAEPDDVSDDFRVWITVPNSPCSSPILSPSLATPPTSTLLYHSTIYPSICMAWPAHVDKF